MLCDRGPLMLLQNLPRLSLTVRTRPSHRNQGILCLGNATFTCALGRSGAKAGKREGDGATPIGHFALKEVFFRPDRVAPPATFLPVMPLARDMGWCDDPDHPCYNRPVRLPFPASHEHLWREDHLYDIVVVLDYNLRPVIRSRGSAVFFHLARPGYRPTEGCVAVSERDMRRILRRCGPDTILSVEG